MMAHAVLLDVLPKLGHLLASVLFLQVRLQHGTAPQLGAPARNRVVLLFDDHCGRKLWFGIWRLWKLFGLWRVWRLC
jgi:hypothetical protein